MTERVSPACGVVELRCHQRICGAASGGRMAIVGVGAGHGVCEGAETPGTGEELSAGDGDRGAGGEHPAPEQVSGSRSRARSFEDYDAVAVAGHGILLAGECSGDGRLVDFLPVLRIVRPVVNEPSLTVKVDGGVRIEA